MRDQGELLKVKEILKELNRIAPGHAVEVRIPPYAAIQCVDGPKHSRGTPPSVVEMAAETLFALVTGKLTWQEGRSDGAIHASGERSDLTELFARIRITP